MAFTPSLRKHARWLLAPMGLIGVAFVNAIVRTSWEDTAKEGKVNLSLWRPLTFASNWLAGHWFGLLGWMLALALLVMICLAYRDERRQKRGTKIFTPRTTAELFAIAGSNHLQSIKNTILDPHIGTWIRVEGSIEDIEFDPLGRRGALIRVSSPLKSKAISLFFSSDFFSSTIRLLDKGDQVTAEGRIEGITAVWLTLADCELIDFKGKALR